MPFASPQLSVAFLILGFQIKTALRPRIFKAWSKDSAIVCSTASSVHIHRRLPFPQFFLMARFLYRARQDRRKIPLLSISNWTPAAPHLVKPVQKSKIKIVPTTNYPWSAPVPLTKIWIFIDFLIIDRSGKHFTGLGGNGLYSPESTHSLIHKKEQSEESSVM